MKFSLKDLLLSMTFASLGMALLAIIFNVAASSGGLNFASMFALILIALLPGILFGAAIGKLSHNMKYAVSLGLVMGYVAVMFLVKEIIFISLIKQ